jgi:hypothetical protein
MSMKKVAFLEVAWSFSYQPAMSLRLIDEQKKGGFQIVFAGVFHTSRSCHCSAPPEMSINK